MIGVTKLDLSYFVWESWVQSFLELNKVNPIEDANKMASGG